MIRTRLMLECSHCGDSKLISVSILDDVMGPVICDSCITQAIMSRRTAKPAPAPEPAVELAPRRFRAA